MPENNKSSDSRKSVEILFHPPDLEKYSPAFSPSQMMGRKKFSFQGYGKLILGIIVGLAATFFSLQFYFNNGRNYSSKNYFAYLKAPLADFTGREKYLDRLFKELIAGKKPKDYSTHVQIRELWGKGGVRKK